MFRWIVKLVGILGVGAVVATAVGSTNAKEENEELNNDLAKGEGFTKEQWENTKNHMIYVDTKIEKDLKEIEDNDEGNKDEENQIEFDKDEVYEDLTEQEPDLKTLSETVEQMRNDFLKKDQEMESMKELLTELVSVKNKITMVDNSNRKVLMNILDDMNMALTRLNQFDYEVDVLNSPLFKIREKYKELDEIKIDLRNQYDNLRFRIERYEESK